MIVSSLMIDLFELSRSLGASNSSVFSQALQVEDPRDLLAVVLDVHQ